MPLKHDSAVIFGTGPLGLSVMDALLEQGQTEMEITLVNRSGSVGESLPGGVRVVEGDAADPDSVSALGQTADVLFHCAQPAYSEWPRKFPPITRGIMEGASRQNVPLVYGDNLYMYGEVDGPIHEDLPYSATTRKGRVRAQMAKSLLDAHRSGKLKVAIGRGSDFFGPRVRMAANVGEMLFDAALEGNTVNLLGDIDQPHTYTYIKDFGRALVTLSQNEEAFGEVWHVPNPDTVTTREFVRRVEQQLDRPLKTRAAGRWMITVLGWFSADIHEQKEMMYEFEQPFVVDHGKFRRAFGADPTPLDSAIQETIAWYRRS